MTAKEIDKMVKRRDELTENEKNTLMYAILQNDKARQRAINGAICTGNTSLAYQLSLMNCA